MGSHARWSMDSNLNHTKIDSDENKVTPSVASHMTKGHFCGLQSTINCRAPQVAERESIKLIHQAAPAGEL